MQRKISYPILVFVCSLFCFLSIVSAQSGGGGHSNKPTISGTAQKKKADKTKIFKKEDLKDPKKRPKDFPGLKGNEKAVMEPKSELKVSLRPKRFVPKYKTNKDGSITVTVEIQAVIIDIKWWNIIWLPDKGSTPKLVRHEKGHALLADLINKFFAKIIAEREAGNVIKQKKVSATAKGTNQKEKIANANKKRL